MRVFVAGATGVLGQVLVPLLVRSGHGVRALARSEGARALLESYGAEPVDGDLFDTDALARGIYGCDAAVHIATSIPKDPNDAAAWARNDRVRREGVVNLLEAGRRAGISHYVQQGIVFLYAPGGAEWIDESSPLSAALPPHLVSARDMEGLVANQEIPWTLLRGGSFYGPGTGSSERLLERAANGSLTLDGDGSHYLSPVHVEDMAQAFLKAIERPPARRVFNVVDDHPVTQADLFGFLAKITGGPPPTRDRTGQAPSLRCSNARIRREFGFSPRYPSYREGYAAMLSGLGHSQPSGGI